MNTDVFSHVSEFLFMDEIPALLLVCKASSELRNKDYETRPPIVVNGGLNTNFAMQKCSRRIFTRMDVPFIFLIVFAEQWGDAFLDTNSDRNLMRICTIAREDPTISGKFVWPVTDYLERKRPHLLIFSQHICFLRSSSSSSS